MLEISSGQSDDIDVEIAVGISIAEARKGLSGPPQAGLFFCGVDLDHEAMAAVFERELPGVPLIGTTTDGELSGGQGHAEDSVLLMLFYAPRLRFIPVSGEVGPGEDESALGQRLARELAAEGGSDLRLAFTFLDLTLSDGEAMLEAARIELGASIPLFGGAAADRFEFRKTLQFHLNGGGTRERGMAMLGIAGPIRYGVGVWSGRRPVGNEATVTRAENNLVYEFDGVDALEYLSRHSPEGRSSVATPLAVAEQEWNSFYIRAPNALRSGDKAVRFMGRVPQGARVRLSHARHEEMRDASREAMARALEDFDGAEPRGALLFSCTMRKHLLGSESAGDARGASELLGDRPMAGYFSFGEIAPTRRGGETRLHNETLVVVLLGEPKSDR